MSGMPTIVAEREAKADADLDKLSNGEIPAEMVNDDAPVVADEAVEEIPAEEPTSEVAEPVAAPDAEVETLKQQNAELVEQVRVLQAQNVTIKGKYEKEVPRLHDQLAEIRAELKELKAKPAQPEKPAFTSDLLPEEQGLDETEALGTQGRAAVGKAKGIVEEARNEINKRLVELELKVKADESEKETQEFLAEVERRAGIPNAASLNNDFKFVAFLDTVDPLSGQTYKEIGQRRMASRDIGGVADIFRTFLAKTPTPASPRQTPANQAKPEVSRSTARPVSTDKPKLTMSAAKAFYEAVKQGAYGRNFTLNPDFVKQNEIIEDAMEEGRITSG